MTVLRVVFLVLWILPIILGVYTARKKKISPHIMWYSILFPIGAWIAYILVAMRPRCPKCELFKNKRASEVEAKTAISSGVIAFRPPRKCLNCGFIWEPETWKVILAISLPVGLVVMIFGAVIFHQGFSQSGQSQFSGISPIVGGCIFLLGGGLFGESLRRLFKESKENVDKTDTKTSDSVNNDSETK